MTASTARGSPTPTLVPVALEVFDAKLGDKPKQLDRRRDDVNVTAAQLLAAKETPGSITEAGVRNNISVGIQYLESWLRGGGAVAIFNLMEDAATAEISRSQIWQWVHNGASTAEGTPITPEFVRQLEEEELEKISQAVGEDVFAQGKYDEACELVDQVALADDFVEFLTLPAYERIARP
jgi:malate synthase